MTTGVRIQEEIDEMRRTGRSPLDIAELIGNLAIAMDKQDTEKDNHFSVMDGPNHSRRQALCNKCDGNLIPSRNPKTNERIYICQTCGNKTNPKIDVMTYSTGLTTVEGFRRRKMGAAKLSGSRGNIVALEQDEQNRDLYAEGKGITQKKITATGDDKQLEKRSGVSITDVQQINPS